MACPKHMQFGPCGGVMRDHTCEVPGVGRCPFLDAAPSLFPLDDAHAAEPADVRSRPLGIRHVVDLRPGTIDDRSVERVRAVYRDCPDGTAFLLGEHLDDPEDGLTIAARVRHTIDRLGNLPLIVTLTGRSRDPYGVAEEVQALAEVGVVAVHCVTGDHPAARLGPGAGERPTPLFLSEASTMIARASARLPVSVAATPASPPLEVRPRRLRSKQRAGARLAICNHGGPATDLHEFRRRCRRSGVTIPMIAPIPMVHSADDVRRLQRFPGLALDVEFASNVLRAPRAAAAGRSEAVALARRLLEDGTGEGFDGCNLSGVGHPDPVARAELVASILDAVS